MTKNQAKEWLLAIQEKYIHGGDDEMDAKRKEAIDMAIRSLDAWKLVEKQITTLIFFNTTGDYITEAGQGMQDCLYTIHKALGEVGENNDTSADS